MYKNELVQRVAGAMRECGLRKSISSPKCVFHISDDEGNTKDFIVKKSDKRVIYTIDDVEAVIDACISVIQDAIKRGEHVSIRGFGTFELNYRKARKTKHPETGEVVNIKAHYVPKFTSGKDLKLCAKIYELSQEDKAVDISSSDYDYDEDGDL